jgi:hypothetical protein
MGALGGYSAARNGGDISQGVLFGTAVGAIAGGAQAAISAAYPVASVGDPSLSSGFLLKAVKVFGMHAVGGAGAKVQAVTYYPYDARGRRYGFGHDP